MPGSQVFLEIPFLKGLPKGLPNTQIPAKSQLGQGPSRQIKVDDSLVLAPSSVQSKAVIPSGVVVNTEHETIDVYSPDGMSEAR